MVIIKNDDDIYLVWIERNPTGFVVNAHTIPTRSYLMLHRAACSDIRSEARTNWTTTQYIKVCSQHKSDLVRWAATEVGGELQPCQRCRPDEVSA